MKNIGLNNQETWCAFTVTDDRGRKTRVVSLSEGQMGTPHPTLIGWKMNWSDEIFFPVSCEAATGLRSDLAEVYRSFTLHIKISSENYYL